MTIKEYMDDLQKLDKQFAPSEPSGRKFSEVMADTCQVWNNAACKGYLIRAAELLKMDPATIQGLVYKMERVFDDYTIDEAEAIYQNSQY